MLVKLLNFFERGLWHLSRYKQAKQSNVLIGSFMERTVLFLYICLMDYEDPPPTFPPKNNNNNDDLTLMFLRKLF